MRNTSIQSAKATIDLGWQMFLSLAVVLAATMIPFDSFAQAGQDSNAFETVLSNVICLFTGTTGKAIATVAVIAVGIGALLGKISWGMALIITIGIALVFGAAGIVNIIGAGAGNSSNAPTAQCGF